MTNSPLPSPTPPSSTKGSAPNSQPQLVEPPRPVGQLPTPNKPPQLTPAQGASQPLSSAQPSQNTQPPQNPRPPQSPPQSAGPQSQQPPKPVSQTQNQPRPAQPPQASRPPQAVQAPARPAQQTSAPKPGPRLPNQGQPISSPGVQGGQVPQRPPTMPPAPTSGGQPQPPKITQPPRPGVTPPAQGSAPAAPVAQAPKTGPLPTPTPAPRPPQPQAPAKPPQMPPKPGAVAPKPPVSQPVSQPRPGVPTPTPTVPTPPPSVPTPPAPQPRPSMPPAPPAGGPPMPPGPAKPPAPVGTPLPPTPPAAAPKMAAVRKSPLRFLPFIIGGLAILGLIVFLAMRFLGGSTPQSVDTTPSTNGTPTRTTVPGQQTTLTYWGLWEPSDVLTEVFDEFEAANPGVSIVYTKQSPTDYRERLQTGIASGSGPDLFRFHASWTPMLRNELAPLPSSVMSTSEFQKTFYPVAYKQLQVNSQLVGIPLMYDGLALYYNKEMLRTANAQPPQTWADLRTLATQLTIKSGNEVQRAGLAVGNASNVEHFADIIGLLMLQNGAQFTNPTTPEARDALLFYTNFMKVDKVWSDTLPNSTTAFARGDVAMMFAPSWRAHEIKAQNPGLDFGIAPLPKLGDNKVTWATYWAEGVNTQSKNKELAWKLLKFMSTPETMKKMYSAQSEVRTFGEPYSRVDLANELASQPLVAPYLADAPTAEGWYLSTMTHDKGINDQLIKYYQDAVNAILTSNKSIEDVMATLNQGTTQVLRQYNVPVTATN